MIDTPWGGYEEISTGPHYRVRRVTINPGKRTSLHYHQNNGESLFVESGTAKIESRQQHEIGLRVETISSLTTDQYRALGAGMVHRITNGSKENPLVLIETVMGNNISHEDIIRLEDDYNRV